MRPLGTDMCWGGTYIWKRRGEIGDPWEVPTERRERMLGESWKTKVQVLSDRKEETQSTMQEGTWEASSIALRVGASTL